MKLSVWLGLTVSGSELTLRPPLRVIVILWLVGIEVLSRLAFCRGFWEQKCITPIASQDFQLGRLLDFIGWVFQLNGGGEGVKRIISAAEHRVGQSGLVLSAGIALAVGQGGLQMLRSKIR